MLAAEVQEPVRGAWRLPGTKLHRLVVWTFQRGGSNPAAWFPRQVSGRGRARARASLPPDQGL